MPGWWRDDDWTDIVTESVLIRIGPIEKKEKFVFRMVFNDPAQGLIHEPANAFQPTLEQQPGVHSDLQKDTGFGYTAIDGCMQDEFRTIRDLR